jgi:preprotein translocase subunit YajC
MMIAMTPILAQAAKGGGPLGNMMIPMLIIFGIMYFMMIRPQRRRDKARKAMIANVKAGDRVLLTSGILGQIRNINETSIMVQIAEKTKIEVVKAAISQVLEEGETPSEIEPAK